MNIIDKIRVLKYKSLFHFINTGNRFKYLQEGVIEFIQDNISYRFRDFKYFILHRTTLKFHSFKSSLKPGYHDCSQQILYFNMDLFKRFYEEEVVDGIVDWDSDPEHIEAKKKMDSIYTWWSIYEFKQEELQILYSQWGNLCKGSVENSCYNFKIINNEQFELIDKKIKELEKRIYDEEQDHLLKLISIRAFLWT